MTRFALVLLVALFPFKVQAQIAGGNTAPNIVPTCGAASYPAGTQRPLTMDVTGKLCTGGSGSGGANEVTIVGPNGPEGGVSVAVNPLRKDAANDSGSIAIGGSWQMAIPENPLRVRDFIQNRCSAQSQGIAASESIFLNLGPNMPTTTDGAIELTSCGVYDSSSFVLNTQPVWLYAETTGHKYIALEW